MNQLLLIIGMIALSNGDISLLDNKSKGKKMKKRRRKNKVSFDIDDVNKGIKMLELSDEDLDRGMEIINKTKKYMQKDEQTFLIKIESILDLVKGIKKLSGTNSDCYDDTDFFRSMDDEDKKNMMIREILEVFPEKKRDSFDKAVDLKKKIELFAELFLPDEFSEEGFSLGSLINFNNLGSLSNLGILGDLFRNNDEDDEDLDNENNDEDDNEETIKYDENDNEETIKSDENDNLDTKDLFENYIKQEDMNT